MQAEGVQSYFNVEAYANPPDGIHNHVNTREKLQDYDPGLYNLIASFFQMWKYLHQAMWQE